MGKSRAKKDPSYEGRLLLAIDAVNNKKVKNVRQVARLYDITQSTLQRRLQGSISERNIGIARRKLTPTEEETLQR
jgi:hypothetical protein